ncbi:hypothetical protein [Streptomyces scabiei]|uniref:hypothetical protein n=1 Tax=Streptomyces scabiei TaxID=1930 RepID=UPI000ADA11FA|nr:hypothetical protein [Streptomyces scabiei]
MVANPHGTALPHLGVFRVAGAGAANPRIDPSASGDGLRHRPLGRGKVSQG